MNLGDWPGGFVYLVIFIAAAVEGEMVFVTASVLVGLNRLNATGVLIAGALGGSAGDQFYYYALRGRLKDWLARFPAVTRRREAVARRIRRHASALILACRFMPGLRIAIPAACAYVGISAVRFSTLSLIGGFAWATVIMLIVARLGPKWSAAVGLKGWWSLIVPAVLMFVFLKWIGHEARTLEREDRTA